MHDRILEAGKHLLVESVDALASGNAEAVPQQSMLPEHGELKEAPKFKEHGRIDWGKSAQEVHNLVRGLNPFPGAWTTMPDGTTLRVHQSRKADVDFGGQPGTVHMGKGQLSVQCGDGAIDVLRLQPQGKPAMDVKSFLNGLRSPLRILGS